MTVTFYIKSLAIVHKYNVFNLVNKVPPYEVSKFSKKLDLQRLNNEKVMDTYPYELNKNQNYFKNEEIAYEAGTNLFIKSLKYFIKNINKS